MSTEILVAIIGATAAVLSAIITVKTKKGKHTSNHSIIVQLLLKVITI